MNYHHEWRQSCADAKAVIGAWYMHNKDVHGKPTKVPFVKGRSPMINGIEVKRHSDSVRMNQPQTIKLLCSDIDTQPSSFWTYQIKDGSGCDMKWMNIMPCSHFKVTVMLANTRKISS